MQVQPNVPASKKKDNTAGQTMLVVALAFLGLALLALWPNAQPETVAPTTSAVNVEAVNPELRLADRYVAPAVAPEARTATNPELAAHERYVAQQAAVRATVEAPAFQADDGVDNPQQALPAFKQSR